MIEDSDVYRLRQIPDERGTIMRVLRCNAPRSRRFEEVYFTVVDPGVIKE